MAYGINNGGANGVIMAMKAIINEMKSIMAMK
jgi:isopentenyl diphosphate isomerase/L-lactate dehydrogenase-like FMN-dependent dehydrogenase